MKYLVGFIVCLAALAIGPAHADPLNEYFDARPIVGKSMSVRIAILYEMRALARKDGFDPYSKDPKVQQYLTQAVRLLKQRCADGTLTRTNGNKESDCKIIAQIED